MNHEIVPEHKPRHIDADILALLCLFAFIPLVFLIGASLTTFGFMPTFIGILVLLASGLIIWLLVKFSHHRMKVEQHQQEQKTHEHHRDLATLALTKGYSVQLEHPDGRKVILTSPLTIPNGPVTIKEMNVGHEMEALPPSLPIAPPFRQIASRIGPGHLFLGQGVNGPVWGDVTDLLSTIIAGRPGTGKSTKLRCVCAQVLIIEGQPIIFDPHGSILDDLGSAFVCVESPRDIAEQSHWLDRQLNQRLRERRAGQTNFKPLLLLVDEMPVISEMSSEALSTIRHIVLEGRKVGMFALISGQGVPASTLGGTLVRDAMASRYVFNTTPQQARLAGLDNETAKTMMAILEDAGPGKAVLATSNSKPEIVAIPDTTIDDIRALVNRTVPVPGNILMSQRNDEEQPMEVPDGDMLGVPEKVIDVPVTVLPKEREQIIRLAKAGISRREMCFVLGKGKYYYGIVKQVLDEEGL